MNCNWKLMKSLLYSFLAIALAVSDASATAQVGDVLEYEGQREELYTTPLEDYFNKDRKRPEFPEQSTACWRGYIAL